MGETPMTTNEPASPQPSLRGAEATIAGIRLRLPPEERVKVRGQRRWTGVSHPAKSCLDIANALRRFNAGGAQSGPGRCKDGRGQRRQDRGYDMFGQQLADPFAAP